MGGSADEYSYGHGYRRAKRSRRLSHQRNRGAVLKRSKYSFIEAGAAVGKTPSLAVAAVAAVANLAYQRPTLDVLIARVLAKVALIYLIALSRAN